MCLAVPMRLESVEGLSAVAEFGGVRQDVNLAILPDARPGEYVIVHAGFAIERLDEEEAEKTLELFRQMDESLEEESHALD